MIPYYLQFSQDLLDNVIARYGLSVVAHDRSEMDEWFVSYENDEFVLCISKDLGDFAAITLGSKIQRRPNAQLRGPWSMGHLKGFISGKKVHFEFKNIGEEVSWLDENDVKLFDSTFLNSDELNQWAIKAAKRLFG